MRSSSKNVIIIYKGEVIFVETKKLICTSCYGEFELTAEGKQIYKDNNSLDPRSCCQCSIIKDINSGRKVKDYAKVITDSSFWTPERKKEYYDNLSHSLNNERQDTRSK